MYSKLPLLCQSAPAAILIDDEPPAKQRKVTVRNVNVPLMAVVPGGRPLQLK
jgi:hypothetical protein